MNRYERYKDSGIPWLGEVPEHWNIVGISKLFMLKAGGDLQPDFFSREKDDEHCYPIYTNANDEHAVYGYTSKKRFNADSITVSGRGDIGFAVYRDHDFDAIIRLLVLSPLKKLDCKYYTYSINALLDFKFESSAVAQLSTVQLAQYKLLLPDYEEQTAIAHYLDTKLGEIDALIGKQQILLEKLAEQRTAVITHAVTKGLNPAAPMKNSGVEWLGDVPAHWNVSYLKFYYEVQLGKMLQPKSNNTDDFEISYFKAFHVQWNNIMTVELPLMWVNPSELDKYTVNNGDLLICEGGEVGRCSILRNLDGIAIIQNAVHRVRTLKNSEIRYLDYVIRHIASVGWFNILCNKATIAHLTSEKLINLNIPIPPKDEQINIADYLDKETDKIDRLCETINQTIGRLKEYRTALITQAVTGKIKVTDE